MREYDALVVGGGPGGATAATFLAKGGLHVALFERELFPRFHVGESLMPATMLLLEQLGVREAIEASGFQVKYGATFTDHESARTQTFYFLRGMPWPHYTFQVPRAAFDTVLLEHARKCGVDVHQPATVTDATFDPHGVTVLARSEGGALSVRGRVLVDASGRDGFLASRIGRRARIPNLGKVALFAHFRGGDRFPGIDEGNIRIHTSPDGWFWWIPLAGDLTSVGAVLHARSVRAWDGPLEELYARMIDRCPPVVAALSRAERVTPVHREANFAYINSPVVGDRFLAVGDAVAFVDPIFSAGVYVAMRTAQLAAEAILRASADGRFTAARFAPYERAVWGGVRPLFRFIHKYYEPAFLELFMGPRNYFGIYSAVLNVLSGGSFIRMTWRTRGSLAVLFALARANTWLRRRAGRPIESRLEW
jgi:flavin-dependent dehydrogenase